jgi:hypothetical protein
MRKRALRALALGASLAVAISGGGFAAEPFEDGAVPIPREDDANHDHAQHEGPDGHLAATDLNVDVVGKMRINQDQEGRVADVGVLGNYAYLAAWSAPNCQKGGVYVFDISTPSKPKQINFIRTANDSYSGEGIQAVHLSTPAFTGDLLAFNNEDCLDKSQGLNAPSGKTSKHSIGGASFIDVTKPKVHKYLAEGVGDRSNGPFGTATNQADAHEIHSVFVWEDEQGTPEINDDKAYAVIVDNEEQWDVDILDITNPRSPVLIAEHDLNALFPQIIQADLGSGSSFLHDMVVKEIDGDQVMLLSYWDGGYVALNVNNPAEPTYISDSDFTNPDPLLNERVEPDPDLPPEGNGHQAEFSLDNDFVVAADEDFGPFTPFISIDGGPQKPFSAGTATGPSLGEGDTLAGPTRFVGFACDASVPAAASADEIAIIERGPAGPAACSFQAKFDNVTAKGYAAGIVFNHNVGCEGLVNMAATVTIPSFFVARSDGYAVLGVAGYDADACSGPALPAVGTAGLPISITVAFDGWGYVHLYSYPDMTELDTYAIPEAHDPTKATGFGDLSVHEVAMSHQLNDLAYFAYYSGGLRVARIVDDELVEVGRFIDQGGNNFWGVQVWEHEGKEYVLASDRDFGVYIFEYTGPGNPNS